MVKVLDFGLAAMAQTPAGDASNPSNSPTLTISPTRAGMILGTAAYMSPEQARGKTVDKRADVWAFGVVLYEMLTGKQAFTGETITDVLAAVVMSEPDWEEVPSRVRRLLVSCLQKDPKQRLRDIGDAWQLLEEGPQVIAPSRSRLGRVAAAVMAIIAIIAGAGWWRSTRPVDRPLIRLSVDLGPDAVASLRITAVISPDGTRIVFPVRGAGGTQQLATRLLNQGTPTLLPATENGSDPFFKPDGQWIGFNVDGKLKKIPVFGGAAVTICDAPNLRGASWGEDDNIIFTPGLSGGLWRVPAAGGKPEELTQPASKGELAHRWPQILPGGKAVESRGLDSAPARLLYIFRND